MENNNFKPFPFEQLKQKKEPEKTAVAIAYEPGEKAPKILATGKGYLADKIIEKAKEEDVPLYQDNQLANTLSRLEIGDKRVRFRLTKTINLRLPFPNCRSGT